MSTSIDTTVFVPSPSRASACLDWLQMLTGAGLILFMWAHMILVASVIIGPGVMNAIAHFFEATYMAQVGGPLIGLIFLLHFVLAARRFLSGPNSSPRSGSTPGCWLTRTHGSGSFRWSRP